MNASPPIFELLENALRILTITLATGLNTVENYIDTYLDEMAYVSKIENAQPVHITLTCENDCSPSDIDILLRRLEKIQAHPKLLQQSRDQVTIEMRHPFTDQSSILRIFSKGDFMISGLLRDDDWLRTFTETHPHAGTVVLDTTQNSNRPAICSRDRETLLPYATLLTETQHEPLIECKTDYDLADICLLHILDKKDRVQSQDIIASKIVLQPQGNYISLEIQFSPPAAARFYALTQRNVHNPVPIIFNGKLLSMPIVQDSIQNGTVQIGIGDLLSSHDQLRAVWDANVLSAILETGPLTGTWSIVKMTPILPNDATTHN